MLPANTIAALDRGYNSARLCCQCSKLPLKGTLIRLKGHRCVYRRAPLPTGKLGYVLRFSQERGYRFDKQALLWEEPRLRTPAQFERWSHLVAIVHNHLVLARELVEASLRPWENKQREPTPQQVRRGMSKLLPQLGTPAHPPQPRGKSPGRAKGAEIGKAKRFAVVRKTPQPPKLVPI